jgi:quercetin dioxygenase-like cupin family protein
MKRIIFLLIASLSCFKGISQSNSDSSASIKVFPDKIVWTDAKPPLQPGAKTAILEGNPKQPGIYTIRMKFPPHYKLAAHVHPADERVTVLSGSINVGTGDKLDEKNATHYTAGCFYVNRAGVHHYVFTGDEEAVFQLTGIGPWGIEFIEDKK